MSHQQLLALARMAVAQRAAQTPAQILEVVRNLAALPFISPPPAEGEIVDVATQIEREFEVVLGPAHAIQASGHKPWLRSRAYEIDFRYWQRYRQYLIAGGMSEQVVNAVDTVTDTIVDLAGDPKIGGSWSRRGLVVGHVQSGKTANYLGVINKASDAGYRVVILIAGVHSNLRSQTQERVDMGFVGRDSDQILSRQVNVDRIGVGLLNPSFTATAFTSRAHDFSRVRAEGLGTPLQNSVEPVILVIKKNKSILNNLIDWIRGTSASHGGLTLPMLVIDDEADNASVDTARDPEAPRTINRLIRELLSLSTRNTYIGYTATPFANIFIDPDGENEAQGKDLFPKDFIVGLDAPSNYVGAQEFFVDEDSGRMTVELENTEEWLPVKHRIDWQVDGLHPSLEEAIDCFVVSKAIRILRGQGNRHHSMLVNVSRFTRIQGAVADEISRHMVAMKAAVQNRHALPVEKALADPTMASLQHAWDKHYSDGGEVWADVQRELHKAIAGVGVVQINASKAAGKLDYRAHAETGLNVIAVGGNSLSRGFTLEGLTVSYFLRNTQMYDTLMQMGRWFGYRDGYQDLCRLFLHPEASDWYGFIASATEELRDEIRRMEIHGLTPMDFGLAVRAHPGSLLVTARDKMRHTEEIVRDVSLAGKMVETSVLRDSDSSREKNVEAISRLVETLLAQGKDAQRIDQKSEIANVLFRGVEVTPVLDFISSFATHPGQLEMQTAPLSAYIRERGLSNWDVLLASSSRAKQELGDVIEVGGLPVGLQERLVERRNGQRTGPALLVSGTKRRVASRGMERIGLTEAEIQAAHDTHGDSKKNIPDHLYRAQRSSPLLMLHLLRTKTKSEKEETRGEVHAAYGLSFPGLVGPEKEKLVRYTANLIAYRELYGNAEDEQDDDELED